MHPSLLSNLLHTNQITTHPVAKTYSSIIEFEKKNFFIVLKRTFPRIEIAPIMVLLQYTIYNNSARHMFRCSIKRTSKSFLRLFRVVTSLM